MSAFYVIFVWVYHNMLKSIYSSMWQSLDILIVIYMALAHS